MKDEKVRALLRFIQTDEPGEDDFSRRLSEFVAKVKENEKFRKQKKRPPKRGRPPSKPTIMWAKKHIRRT